MSPYYKRSLCFFQILVLLSGTLFFSGCSWLGCGAVAVGGATAMYVAQERSAGRVVDDFAIWAGIKSKLLQYGGAHMSDVHVSVSQGRVMLTGHVGAPRYRMLATQTAWEQSGVEEVINEIQLRGTHDALTLHAKDIAVAYQVKTRLLLTKNIRSINYTVESVEGITYLFGIAYDEEELNAVIDIAAHVRGVKKVVSHVRFRKDL